MSIALRLILAAGVLLAIDYSGYWVWLISHPWWSLSSTLHGIAAGVVLSLAAIWARQKFSLGFVLVLAVSVIAFVLTYVVTAWGKNGFAVSYAEDLFAGRVWFIGFKAMNMFLFTSLVLAWPDRRHRVSE